MVHLQKMDADEFSRYLPRLIEGYAQEMSENMDLALDAARERSTRQIHELLPQGTDTPNHLIYDVQVEGSPETAGYLWVFMDPAKKTTFIYDIEIAEALRGQGLGRATLQAIEAQLHDLGIVKLSLHVFGDNPTAILLYQSQGFVVTGMNMMKRI